jgi:hypothetical protein
MPQKKLLKVKPLTREEIVKSAKKIKQAEQEFENLYEALVERSNKQFTLYPAQANIQAQKSIQVTFNGIEFRFFADGTFRCYDPMF